MDDIDIFGDEALPEFETNFADLDGGIVDIQETLVDLNGDGVADMSFTDIDLNGDGISDMTFDDLDGDGEVDVFGMDFDGDGSVDFLAANDQSEQIWGDLDSTEDVVSDHDFFTDTLSADYSDFSFSGFEGLYETHGTPDADMALWDQQDDPMSCAVATTSMMMDAAGIEGISEDMLADVLESQGVYDPITGSDPKILDDAINQIASENNLPIQAVEFSVDSIEDYEQLLDNGVRPLIAVDSAELYASGFERTLNDLGILPGAGHAVQLTGIEHTPEGTFAVINDPGGPGGAGVRIPFEAFDDAAKDHHFSGVAVLNQDTATAFATMGIESANNQSQLGTTLGAFPGAEPVSRDIFGNMFRGDSCIPFAGPSAPPTSPFFN